MLIEANSQTTDWSSDFSKLEAELIAALRPGETWWDTAKDVLRHLSRPEALAEVLRSLMDSPERLAEVAGRSISHSLGFDKIVLIDPRGTSTLRQTAFRLRLHLWKPQPTVSQPEEVIDGIHNHFTSLTSSVVCGVLTNQIYEVTERGHGDWYHYKALPLFSNETNRQSAFPFQERVTLACTHEAELAAGTIYHLPFRTLHSSSTSTAPLTATLLLYGPYETQETDLFRMHPISETAEEVKQRFTPEVLAKKLEEFIAQGLEIH